MGVPVSVMKTAGEGGPWGMALLAGYCLNRNKDENLENYLQNHIFIHSEENTQTPDKADQFGFSAFMKEYIRCLPVERAAVDALR